MIINPGPEVLTVYRTMQRDFAQLRDRLIERRDLPTVTPDGVDVELMANIHDLAAPPGRGFRGGRRRTLPHRILFSYASVDSG